MMGTEVASWLLTLELIIGRNGTCVLHCLGRRCISGGNRWLGVVIETLALADRGSKRMLLRYPVVLYM